MNPADLLTIDSTIPGIEAEKLFSVFGIEVTNSMTSGFIVLLILCILSVAVYRKVKTGNVIPSNFQIVLEMIYEALFGFVTQLTGSEKVTVLLLPLFGSIFLYIALANTFTLFPPFFFMTYDIGGEAVSLFRTHTNDFNTTFGISLTLILSAHMVGIGNKGFVDYIDQYIPIPKLLRSIKENPKGIFGAIFTFVIDLLVGLLDLVGEFAKSFSVALRLFGNMFAGEVLMVVFLSLFSFLIPAVWTLMGLFTGVIQTIVYGSLLTTSFVGFVKED